MNADDIRALREALASLPVPDALRNAPPARSGEMIRQMHRLLDRAAPPVLRGTMDTTDSGYSWDQLRRIARP